MLYLSFTEVLLGLQRVKIIISEAEKNSYFDNDSLNITAGYSRCKLLETGKNDDSLFNESFSENEKLPFGGSVLAQPFCSAISGRSKGDVQGSSATQ